MYPTITMHQQRTPHALDLLADGDLFYWGADTKEAWVVNDLRNDEGMFVARRVAPEGTNSVLNYANDDYEVWVDGGSVNIVGVLNWDTAIEHNDQSGAPGGDEIVADGNASDLTDQLGRPVLVDDEGNYWVRLPDDEGGHLVEAKLFTPRVRAVKQLSSSKLSVGQEFYITPGGDAWTATECSARPQLVPGVGVNLADLPPVVYVHA